MKLKKQKRSDSLEGRTWRIETNYERLFITLNYHKGMPFEVFLRVGKHGGDLGSYVGIIARMISNDLRHGMPISQIVKVRSQRDTNASKRSGGRGFGSEEMHMTKQDEIIAYCQKNAFFLKAKLLIRCLVRCLPDQDST